MEIFATGDRSKWRAWLLTNFETAREVWFVLPLQAAGEESLSYNDAVEEALCFGWIDSTNRNWTSFTASAASRRESPAAPTPSPTSNG